MSRTIGAGLAGAKGSVKATILAIEPDPERAGTLEALVREYVDADVVLAPSAAIAVSAAAEHPPALILASALMSPVEANGLTAHLRDTLQTRVPVLTIPPLGDQPPEPRSGFRSLFGRKTAPRTPARDALGARIKDAFEQARAGAFANEGGLAALFEWLQTERANGMLPALLRRALEQALEGMVAAREIRVRRVPAVENDGSESIYFTIPTGGDAPPLLQITFERDHAPTQEEFDLLAEAAVRAADLLQ